MKRPLAIACLLFAVVPAACDQGGSPVIDTPTSTERSTTTAASGDPTTTTAVASGVIEVIVVGGAPQGGVRTERVTLGDEVVLRVTSDVADEVHVHSYDLKVDVPAGGTGELRFKAAIPGVFEVELERRHTQILELEVRPG